MEDMESIKAAPKKPSVGVFVSMRGKKKGKEKVSYAISRRVLWISGRQRDHATTQHRFG